MKIFSTYTKEMKIAFRGFYFYIELVVAVIALIVLLVVIKENPDGKSEEYLYNEIPDQVLNYMAEKSIENGEIRFIDDTELTIKPSEFTVVNKDTGQQRKFEMIEEKTIIARTYQKLNSKTGKVNGIAYIIDNEEDMIRLAYNSGNIGVTSIYKDDNRLYYNYFLNGYETKRLEEILYILHTFDAEANRIEGEKQSVEIIGKTDRLNNREAFIPVYVAFAGALMGFFVVMSYVFLDKSQGVINAFAVSPGSIWTYLFTKILVMLTTTIITSTIVVIPVMKLKPDYLFFYIYLIAASFFFSSLGLLVASFYDNISKAFGVLYIIMIILMLPSFSYYIGSFDPLWIRFLPTYPLLEGLRDIMKGATDISYILTYSGLFILGSVILLQLASIRFKKTLTV